MTFRPAYAAATVALLLIEVAIALFVHDAFIRPYAGDGLAVILVYLELRAVTKLEVGPALLVALIVAFAIEFGQLFHLLDRLGLGHNRLARVVLGGVFDVRDLGCYVVGAAVAWGVERWRRR